MPITSANIDIGELPNDGSGDPLRVAFDKINNNFEELALLAPSGPLGAIQFKDANALPTGTANFVYNADENTINFGGNFIPTTDGDVDIGSTDLRVGNLWLSNTSLKLGNISVNESGNTISFPVTILPSTLASIEVNDVTAQGNLTVVGSLNLEGTSLGTFDIITTTSDANQIVYETPITSFNSGTFEIISREDGTDNAQSVILEITKSNDNARVSMAAHSTLFLVPAPDIWVTKYNADMGYGNVRVMVSPARNSTITHTISYKIERL